MSDIFLRSGQPNPADIQLKDPTLADAAGGGGTVTGSLSAIEVGSDAFVANGDVIITGLLAASEFGSDILSVVGDVFVRGSLAATEVGSDAFVANGDVIVTGLLAASESGSDTFTTSGDVFITGSIGTVESGSDVLNIIGSVSVPVSVPGIVLGVGGGWKTFKKDDKVVLKIDGKLFEIDEQQDVQEFVASQEPYLEAKVLETGKLPVVEVIHRPANFGPVIAEIRAALAEIFTKALEVEADRQAELDEEEALAVLF